MQCLIVSVASLLDFLFICSILAAITGICWLQYLQMETKHRCANISSRFVSIHIFIASRANSFPWIIQAEVEKVPYIKDFLLGTVETPCTTTLWMEDYFFMPFWGKSVSFSIVAINVVFLRRDVHCLYEFPQTQQQWTEQKHIYLTQEQQYPFEHLLSITTLHWDNCWFYTSWKLLGIMIIEGFTFYKVRILNWFSYSNSLPKLSALNSFTSVFERFVTCFIFFSPVTL